MSTVVATFTLPLPLTFVVSLADMLEPVYGTGLTARQTGEVLEVIRP